tara:strand:+ start:112 stop:240 length:129 start_codon:yes stop_codon:yes gene_type:complete
MPSYLRNFYTQQLIKLKKEEQKQVDKANKGNTSKIHRAGISR